MIGQSDVAIVWCSQISAGCRWEGMKVRQDGGDIKVRMDKVVVILCYE